MSGYVWAGIILPFLAGIALVPYIWSVRRGYWRAVTNNTFGILICLLYGGGMGFVGFAIDFERDRGSALLLLVPPASIVLGVLLAAITPGFIFWFRFRFIASIEIWYLKITGQWRENKYQ